MRTPSIKAIRGDGRGDRHPDPFPGRSRFRTAPPPILQQFGDEREGPSSPQVEERPLLETTSRGAGRAPSHSPRGTKARDGGDSVDGVAPSLRRKDGAPAWKLAAGRRPDEGTCRITRASVAVVLGLYYPRQHRRAHGRSCPTIKQCGGTLGAFGHLYKNGTLVTDNGHGARDVAVAPTRPRRRLPRSACWDCSRNKIEELQLQILPGPGEPKVRKRRAGFSS